MIKISNPVLISVITKLLFLLVIAKSISLVIWWYLPSDGVELVVKSSYQPKYQRVDFNTIIKMSTEIKRDKDEPISNKFGRNITDIILKGLYGTKTKGFVIVAQKSNPTKTTILSIEEIYLGYKLKSITKSGAQFTKNGKDYFLYLDKLKDISVVSNIAIKEDYDGPRGVVRADISYYAKNPKQIWKDISIKELKDGEKIKGFQVTKIKPNSKLATLGLQKGDIIIKANNIKILSYRDALEIYKKIDELDTIQVVVIRDNKEKELIYEIN